jgi:hypothetical protein
MTLSSRNNTLELRQIRPKLILQFGMLDHVPPNFTGMHFLLTAIANKVRICVTTQEWGSKGTKAGTADGNRDVAGE